LSSWLLGCMSAIIVAALVLAVSTHAVMSIAAAAVIGFACGPIFPWLISLTPKRLGAAHGTNAIGVQIASASIGLTLLPTIVGVIGDELGVGAISWALTAIAALLLAGYRLLERASRTESTSRRS